MSLFAAIDGQGNTRYIGEVARGAACGCFCAECKSPVVAKHGEDHVWHFAHEASQERPQCLPGSVNLLRRLAIETLLRADTFALPECRTVLTLDQPYSDIQEEAAWTLPVGSIVQRNLDAPFGKLVAEIHLMEFPACSIGLWVQIGELALDKMGEFAGALTYHCQAPPKGAITSLASALTFLQEHHRWQWQRMPDVFGELEQARHRLQSRQDTLQAETISKLRNLRALMRERSTSNWSGQSPSAPRLSDIDLGRYSPVPVPPPLPAWVELRKKDRPFFAYQLRDGAGFWIAMEAADHAGYYVVPGGGYFEGWDEALPLSVGHADPVKGAYRGEGPVIRAIQVLQKLGVSASRIDTDAMLICAFTGWTD